MNPTPGEGKMRKAEGQMERAGPGGIYPGSPWVSLAYKQLAEIFSIANSGLGNRTELLQQIDGALHHLPLITHALSSYHNSLVPISRIPSEILRIVVSLVGDRDRPYHADEYRTNGHLGWIQLSHVCKRWREVTIGISRLWARDVTIFPKAFETMLARSGSSPLSLVLHTHGPSIHWSQFAHALFLQELRRAKRIRFEGHKSWTSEWPPALSRTTLPLLEELSITQTGDDQFVPANFLIFPMDAPRLHTVSLQNVFIPWTPSALQSLTLSSTRLSSNPDCLPQAKQFLDILQSCAPHLRDLSLRNWIPDMSDVFSNNTPERVLPCPALQSLAIQSTPERCTQLWKCLALPATQEYTRIGLDFLDNADGLDDVRHTMAIERLIDVLADHCRRTYSNRHVRGVKLSTADKIQPLEMRIALTAEVGPPPELDDNVDAGHESLFVECSDAVIFDLYFCEWEVDNPFFVDVYDALAGAFRFNNADLVSIRMREDVDTSEDLWSTILSYFIYTRVLHVSGYGESVNLVSALRNTEDGPMLLPRLQFLNVQCLDLREPAFDEVVQALKDRADSGIKLHRLWVNEFTRDYPNEEDEDEDNDGDEQIYECEGRLDDLVDVLDWGMDR